MKFVFVYGMAAAGKLTVARKLAGLTGFALFHNHLVVDAVAAVFPFGSEQFVKLREQFWLAMFREAAAAGRSIIFTFAPEASVRAGFPLEAQRIFEAAGGETVFVRLTVAPEEQERRIGTPGRAEFGKLRSPALLRALRDEFTACEAAMPPAAITIDTGAVDPDTAARKIAGLLGLPETAGAGF